MGVEVPQWEAAIIGIVKHTEKHGYLYCGSCSERGHSVVNDRKCDADFCQNSCYCCCDVMYAMQTKYIQCVLYNNIIVGDLMKNTGSQDPFAERKSPVHLNVIMHIFF